MCVRCVSCIVRRVSRKCVTKNRHEKKKWNRIASKNLKIFKKSKKNICIFFFNSKNLIIFKNLKNL